MNIRIKDICRFGKKSDIKAGEGNTKGKYMFFTSSIDKDKRIDKFDYDEEGIIMGTGGNATLHYYSGKFTVSTDCLVLLPNSSYKCKYLYYFFLHNMRVLEGGFRGAGLKHTSKSYIENIELTKTHSLLEQDKIISVLSNIDNTIVLQNKRLKLLNELTRSLFIEMFGDPVENPFMFEKQRLSKIGELERGVSKHRPRNAPELLGGKYPLIQTGEISNSDLYINKFENTYSELGLSQSKLWKKGTLCITIAANIAKTGILTFDSCFPDSVVGFVPNKLTNNIFIHYWFSFFQKILEEEAPESAQKNINLKVLSNLDVIVPPIELQNKFAAVVAQIDKSKLAVKKSLEELEILKKSLMQKYFA